VHEGGFREAQGFVVQPLSPMHLSNATQSGSAVHDVLICAEQAPVLAVMQALHAASGSFGSAAQNVAPHSRWQRASTQTHSLTAKRYAPAPSMWAFTQQLVHAACLGLSPHSPVLASGARASRVEASAVASDVLGEVPSELASVAPVSADASTRAGESDGLELEHAATEAPRSTGIDKTKRTSGRDMVVPPEGHAYGPPRRALEHLGVSGANLGRISDRRQRAAGLEERDHVLGG
jgi:hypothetical protein